jgi:NUDIX domain
MDFPVSVKAVVEVDGHVPPLRNERAEWELPGGRLEAGEELEAAAEREVHGGTRTPDPFITRRRSGFPEWSSTTQVWLCVAIPAASVRTGGGRLRR